MPIHTLRLTYPLSPDSIVYDIGGFKGQWASDIYSKYRPRIYIFEPMPFFYSQICKRFAANSDIVVLPFGLANKTCEAMLSVAGDGSSVYFGNDVSVTRVQLVDIIDFMSNNHHEQIDLLKVNIEGGEYDLLPALIESGFVERINNIQVQFHDNVVNARERMEIIQKSLSRSHRLTWQYDFVWENWERIAW